MSSIHLSKLLAKVHSYKRSVDDAFNRDVDAQSVELLLSRKLMKEHLKQSGDALSPRNGLSPDALKLLEDFVTNKTKLPTDVRNILKEVQRGEKSLAEAWPGILSIDIAEDDEDVAAAIEQLDCLRPVIRIMAELQLRHERAEQMGLKAYHAPDVWQFVVQKLTVRGIPCDEERLSEYAAHVGLDAVKGPDDVVDFIARQHNEGLTKELLVEICEKYPDDAGKIGLPDYLESDLPVLSELAAVAYETLLSQPEHKGLIGPKLLEEMDKRGFPSDSSTLTSRTIPELKPYGVENVPRLGYRIIPSKRPKE